MKADAGGQKTRHAGAATPDVDREFGRIGAREQVHCTQQVEKLLIRHPAPPPDHLVAHQGNVGRWSAEADHPQLEEQRDQLAELGIRGTDDGPRGPK